MDGAYLPQHVQRARAEGRLLGQVRDLLIMRKPLGREYPRRISYSCKIRRLQISKTESELN